MWNCFRAKCGWTGRVNTRQGTSKAYRQYTNESGVMLMLMGIAAMSCTCNKACRHYWQCRIHLPAHLSLPCPVLLCQALR